MEFLLNSDFRAQNKIKHRGLAEQKDVKKIKLEVGEKRKQAEGVFLCAEGENIQVYCYWCDEERDEGRETSGGRKKKGSCFCEMSFLCKVSVDSTSFSTTQLKGNYFLMN